jgi:hypothetical protein
LDKCNKKCPVCSVIYGVIIGDTLSSPLSVKYTLSSLPVKYTRVMYGAFDKDGICISARFMNLRCVWRA